MVFLSKDPAPNYTTIVISVLEQTAKFDDQKLKKCSLPVDEVLRDECWQEGEGVVGGDEGESVSGVHGVVGEEVVLLEVHRVQGVDHLKVID